MGKEPKHMNSIYEKRKEEIITPKGVKPTMRIARFLKPIAKNINHLSEIPKSPLLSDIFTHKNLEKWPINVQFTGWNKPQKDWKKWYDNLVINHATTWIEAGIIDGIHVSMHKIICNKDLILGVCEFWCPKTNSFIFPWGEATITLEDVMILAGLPVIGEELNKPIEGNLVKIDVELRKKRLELAERSKNGGGEKEVSHLDWIKHFMEEEEEGEIEHVEGEFEHVAFLSLWLSRFVFPDINEGVIDNHVFAIAIRLSQGTPIALAPVVLANLYHELTLLTRNGIDLALDSNYRVLGLFMIVQVWVVERFPNLGVNLAKPLGVGDRRIARWENVEFEVSLSDVRSKLKAGEGFLWRPYVSDLENWEQLPFYEESEQLIPNCAVLDDCSLSYARFLYPCVINGLGTDCLEKYQPHRVAMQFGYDQDIPGEFRVLCAEWDKIGLYIPSRSSDFGMSKSYYNWWKDSMFRHEEAVHDWFKKKRDKDSGERLTKRQEGRACRLGKKENISCASPLRMLKTCANEGDKDHNDSSDLDKAPLALRVCSKALTNKVAATTDIIRGQTSASLKSSQLKMKGPPDSNNGGKPLASDTLDIDHVPLALRLQSIARSKGTLKPLESYASIGNVGSRLQGKQQTEEVASPRSDAVSHITRKGSSPRKTTVVADTEDGIDAGGRSTALLARVAKLERDVAALAAAKSGSTEFFPN